MLGRIIDISLRHRGLVILTVLVFAITGGLSMQYLNIDAFPDTTPVQVQINTVSPALGPTEVEQQISLPIEQALGGLPALQNLRSVSKFGFSQVTATFADGTDIYFARQLVTERLAAVELSEGIPPPQMGPVSTGLGEVFHYVLTGAGGDMVTLRTIHDWIIKPSMRTVPGVAEINSWGGGVKQYQVRLDPDRLLQYGLTFQDVVAALRDNNRNVGAGLVREGSRAVIVQGLGRVTNRDDIRAIVIAAHHGTPIRIRDVADVEVGAEIRRGAVTADGQGEVVLGLGFMRMGENAHEVTWALKQQLDEIRPRLPANVQITTVYDRTELVDHVLETVRKNLFEGGLLVVAVLFAFLGNLRAALIVALAIPLSLLLAFAGMWRFGISASLLSLGAIDFGMIVDSSVVMVENCVRHLKAGDGSRSQRDIVRDAALEVRRPTLFGELIIMIVYLPILTLEGVEGKLFRPMALTVIFALAGSMVLSLTLMPVLASLCLRRQPQAREPLLMRIAHALHNPLLEFSMRHKGVVLAAALGLLAIVFGGIAPRLGTEFVPRFSEGALVINVIRLAGTDLADSVQANTQLERSLLGAFPDELQHVWSRAGTAEIATDPMGTELTDTFLSLKPRHLWTRAATQDELAAKILQFIRDLPGQRVVLLQPIEMRMNEMVSGARADVAIKLFGDDLDILTAKGGEIETLLRSIPGAADVSVEQVTGQPLLEVVLDREQLARAGVPARAVLDVVEALGGLPVGDVIEDPLRFPLVVRLPETYRQSIEQVRTLVIPTATGERLPLERLARLRLVEGPTTITREWGQRRITVTANVRGRDLGSFVALARQRLRDELPLPTGRYYLEFGGQFEHLQRAQARLLLVVPAAAALVVTLLYLTYHNLTDALRVFTGVPFGWVGGILALWLRGMPFSISAAIGFIALSGVAVLDDMILVSYVRQLRLLGYDLETAVRHAAVTRLRPVLMTTLVASLGFLPMAVSTGVGAEVQRPLATVVIGGVLGAMFMSLLVLRVLYVMFRSPVDWFRARRSKAATISTSTTPAAIP